MADPMADRGLQAFVPTEREPEARYPRGSRHSTALISAPTFQAPEESGNIRARDSTHNASVGSSSPTTSSSTEKVFLTAPQSPTESVEYNFTASDHFSSSLGPYSSAERPDDKRTIVTTSSSASEARLPEIFDDRSQALSSVNRALQAMTEPEQVTQTPASRTGDTGPIGQTNVIGARLRPLSAQEESITGARLGLRADIISNESPTISYNRRRNRVIHTPRSGRRHAIPIVRPATPGSEEPPSERYEHGLDNVPTHYIPLYGSLHGMFYDPVTEMFVGDGPPRPTPERSDSSLPCLPEDTESSTANTATTSTTASTGTAANIINEAVAANIADTINEASANTEPKVAPRRANPEDELHIQTRDFIDNFNVITQPVEGSHPLNHPGPSDSFYPAGRPPNKTLYLCRCTGQWLDNKHECDQGPKENMPEQSGLAISPGTQLPEGWVTHRIVVDPRMYAGGVVPEHTPAGPMVGGLPTKYFTPVSDIGTEVNVPEAARAAAEAIVQNRGTRQVRAMRMGASALFPASFNFELPIRSGSAQLQSQLANDNDNAASTITTAPVVSTAPDPTTITTPDTPDPTTITSPDTPDPTTITIPDTPDPTTDTPESSSHNDPSAKTPASRGRGGPANKVAGQRRQGKKRGRKH